MNSLLFHPNVVLLLGYTEAPNCIVTPLYEGNLSDLIHGKDKQYTTLHAADIVYQICSAMNALHARGVAHRDVKPPNILLEREKPHLDEKKPGKWSDFGFNIRLGDFGICYVDQKEMGKDLKISNVFGFSYQYASPELLSGLKRLSLEDYEQSDVYSFGVCLWELLHREYPWPGLSSQEITEKVIQNQRPEIILVEGQDRMLIYFLPLIKSCCYQDPYSRTNFKSILIQLKGLMEMESAQQQLNAFTPLV